MHSGTPDESGDSETKGPLAAGRTASLRLDGRPAEGREGSGASTGPELPGPPGPTFAAGALLAGRYRVVRFLARGGMGEVYEGEDLELGERIAIKILRPQTLASDDRALERFRREIRLARKVTHPNVCRIFDVCHHRPDRSSRAESRIYDRFHRGPAHAEDAAAPGETTFLSMELLRGETLAERLRRGRMEPAEALPLVLQMGGALHAAHQVGVIHRDFKSRNVILVPVEAAGSEPRAPDGAWRPPPGSAGGAPPAAGHAQPLSGPEVRAVVTDFGLARANAEHDEGSSSITDRHGIVGTPAYMAPEQVDGGETGVPTDIYALGVVIYEMVTGMRPFTAETPLAVALKRLREAPVPPRRHVPLLDARWEAAILRCLELEPAARFASVPELLEQLSGGEPDEALPAAARRSVAILGFKNLSGRSDAAWLSTALSEMFGTELGSGEALRVVPGEAVARAKIELQLSEADGFTRETLGWIRTNLGADHVIGGSYLLLGPTGGGQLRLDVRLQETRAGETLAAVAEAGADERLFELVSRAGARLRERLGVPMAPEGEAERLSASLPSNPRAARLYSEGLRRLRIFDALGARELLQEAVTAEPAHPLPHAALAAAWRKLGYDRRARDAARHAFDLAGSLGREERLAVQGRYHETTGQWAEAVQIYETLLGFFPDNPDYALRLAEALIASSRASEALQTVSLLRRMPTALHDGPRIDLVEAKAAQALDEAELQQTAAANAARKARARGAQLLVAEARLLEGAAFQHLGDPHESFAAYAEARRICADTGDRGGVARAQRKIGDLLRGQGALEEARRRYEGSLTTLAEIGHADGQASALFGLGQVHLARRELDAAAHRWNAALAIRHELGERAAAAECRLALAELDLERGRPAEALEAAASALREIPGKRAGGARLVLARCHHLLGRLDEARAEAEQAAREAGDPEVRLRAELQAAALRGAAGSQAMEACLAEALRRGLVEPQLEARLALAHLLEAGPQQAACEMVRIEAEARGHRRLAASAAR
jgi:eukaryotic-like serine/threonine-protein kinase